MKPVTAWMRLDNTTGGFEFNHIEDGHSTLPKPSLPQFSTTGASQWEAYHEWLTDDIPAKLVAYDEEEACA